MKIVVPMAGAGSRFETAGYTFPKPLIEVQGEPMIAKVVKNLNLQGQYIFLVQKTHYEKYNLQGLLTLIAPNCKIVQIDGLTEGAACTVLKAKEYINNNEPLIIANSDQYIKWNSFETISSFNHKDADGGILSFTSVHPKHSFAKVDSNGYVTEVAEKNPISNIATVGYYFWKNGSDFVKYAEQMIKNNIRVNNEFYVCPVFNEAIKDFKQLRIYNTKAMWGLGTPEDLHYFLENYK